MTTRTMDINCDMGESYGNWVMGNDESAHVPRHHGQCCLRVPRQRSCHHAQDGADGKGQRRTGRFSTRGCRI